MSFALENFITALGVHLAELHQQLFGSFRRSPAEVLLEACMMTDDTAMAIANARASSAQSMGAPTGLRPRVGTRLTVD